jgi:hypothetical protein
LFELIFFQAHRSELSRSLQRLEMGVWVQLIESRCEDLQLLIAELFSTPHFHA